jgi:hypothetical protein
MKLTTVNCNLKDCIFFTQDPAKPFVNFCKYPDILLYKSYKRCPVYRMDWEKKMKAIKSVKKPSPAS